MVSSSRQKQPFTHFISLPINATNLQEAFIEFKTDVLDNCGSERGIEESIFQVNSIFKVFNYAKGK